MRVTFRSTIRYIGNPKKLAQPLETLAKNTVTETVISQSKLKTKGERIFPIDYFRQQSSDWANSIYLAFKK